MTKYCLFTLQNESKKKAPLKVLFFFEKVLLRLLTQHTETVFELINTATSSSLFLLTSVERVTCRTYVQVHGARFS